LNARRGKHTDETAWNWPDDKQCQCADCVEIRSLKSKIKDDLNPRFRTFFLGLEEQFLRLRPQGNFDPADIWAWIDTSTQNAKRFQESFLIQDQLSNANLAKRVVDVFGQYGNVAPEQRDKYNRTDLEKLFLTIEPVIEMFQGLKGPCGS